MNQLQRYLNHSKIDVVFKQNKDDFVVTEVPLYEFTGEGEHLILKIRKKDLSTWDAVEIIANFVGCKTRDIGYAGLKDKNAMTVQSISIHKQYELKLKSLFTYLRYRVAYSSSISRSMFRVNPKATASKFMILASINAISCSVIVC